mmetsp:Transcript_117283/g.164980  ORF Transcript_117283/g.164980 Transcript_117283/m.164980 type:complete len:87 (+) Transcript_117283:167-427(+)
MMVLSFFIFRYLLGNIGVNVNRLPEDGDKRLIVYIFILALIGFFGILGLFWVKINLMVTLKILSIVTIPFFLIGNWALTNLKPEEK